MPCGFGHEKTPQPTWGNGVEWIGVMFQEERRPLKNSNQ